MNKKIAVLAGDGIGPEVTKQAVKALKAISAVSQVKFQFDEGLVGAAAIDATGDPFPRETENLCRSSDAVLFGAIGHPKYDNDPKAKIRPEQGLLRMRQNLGLFANLRPVKSYESLLSASPLKEELIRGVDFVVFRELTGGIYFGKPRGRSEDGLEAFDTCNYNKSEIVRISKQAFEAAKNRNNHVTLVDKANVLATSRLWRETVQELAKDYPDVVLDYMFVDNAAMKMIQNPKYFDVILTENMFGDIITDEASVITGSLGMLPSASVGSEIGVFEPIHGSYPEAAGKNIANPFGAILSAAMLLEYAFSMHKESDLIKSAIDKALKDGHVTQDIDSSSKYGTEEVGDIIARLINEETVAL